MQDADQHGELRACADVGARAAAEHGSGGTDVINIREYRERRLDTRADPLDLLRDFRAGGGGRPEIEQHEVEDGG